MANHQNRKSKKRIAAKVLFLHVFHGNGPECAIWSFPKLRGWAVAAIAVKTRNPGPRQKLPFLKVVQKIFNQRMASHQNRKSEKRIAAKVWFLHVFHGNGPECAIWPFPKLRGWAIAAIAVKTGNPGSRQKLHFLNVFQKKFNQRMDKPAKTTVTT